MSELNGSRDVLRTRFISSMRRISSINTFLHSDIEGIKQTGFGHSEGARADILRATVVFLHAATEDFIRSHFLKPNRRFTFSSASDIKQALHRLKIKSVLFTDLLPALTQMAKRRNQIVHHSDLRDLNSLEPSSWEITDEWQLIHWHLTVSAFYHRIRRATGPTTLVENRASQNVESALIQTVEFANAMVAVADLPPEQGAEGLNQLLNIVQRMRDTMKLEVTMFCDSDGKPLDETVLNHVNE